MAGLRQQGGQRKQRLDHQIEWSGITECMNYGERRTGIAESPTLEKRLRYFDRLICKLI